MNPRSMAYAAALRSRVRVLVHAGHSLKEIQHEVGHSQTYVSQIIKRLGYARMYVTTAERAALHCNRALDDRRTLSPSA